MSAKQKNQKPDKQGFDFDAFSKRLARIEFEQWKYWASQILEQEDISEERAERWRKLFLTDWDDLPDELKLHDYRWASATLDAYREDPFVSLIMIAEYLLDVLAAGSISFDDSKGLAHSVMHIDALKGRFVASFLALISDLKDEMQRAEELS